VLANGILQFGADTGLMRTYNNTALPAGTPASRSGCVSAATARTMFVYWTDLNPSAAGSGGVTWQQKGTAPNRYLVVSWNGVYQYRTTTPYTFQVILYEDGSFKYQYGNANASGSNATIGVQLSNADYTLYSYNSGYNANGSAILWNVAGNSTTRVADIRFDEQAWSGVIGEVRDSSGNSHHGVRVGSATSVAGGYVCRALSVPADTTSTVHGVDTFVNPASTLGNAGGMSFWYRSNGAWNNGTPAMLADARSASSGSFFILKESNGALRAVVPDSSGTRVDARTANQPFAANTWVHIAVSWRLQPGSNQSTVRIYLNGALSATASTTTTGDIDGRLASLHMGDARLNSTSNGATLNSANALIDELRLYNFEIGVGEIALDIANTHSCAPPVDHYELVLPSAGLACLPSTVQVRACADSSSPCNNLSTSATGSTATLTTSAGTLGAGTLTFDSTGQASTTLNHGSAANGTAVSVTLGGESLPANASRTCCADGSSCSTADSCSITFATAGFIVAASGGGAAATVPTQTAGISSGTYWLRAVKSSTTTQACEAALAGAQNIEWALQCEDPATCASGASRLTLTGTSSAVVAANPASGVTSYGVVPMNFDANGNAPFSFNYADVGRIQLHARKAGAGAQTSALSGSSNAFVSKPAGFSITQVRQSASPNLANPAATDHNGSAFVKAGEAFSATVTALTSSGAAAPGFGREATPEGVTISHTLLQPVGGATGTLAGGSIGGGSFSGGTATAAALTFSEVGIISLTAGLTSGNYLGAGSVPASSALTVGRFIPARFALSGASLTHRAGLSCVPASSFTHLGENFRFGFTLTALNATGATTQNYTGSYAKFDPTASAGYALLGLAGASAFSSANGRLSLGSAAGNFSAGAAAISLTAQVTRTPAAEGPHSALFGIAPVDGDGVTIVADADLDSGVPGNDRAALATVALRFGRLRLLSAAGAADRALALPVLAEYWNGSAFDTNTLDSCTAVAQGAISFGNLRRTITSADTAASAPLTLAAGRGSLWLAPPGGGRNGTFDVALSLGSTATDASCLQPWTPASGDAATAGAGVPYLRGAWCGTTYDKDPAARATFGLPRGETATIFRREHY
jgi:MSHA biogenesis protein MshQ